MGTAELFFKVRRKAHIHDIPIDDERFHSLASYFTYGGHEARYLGRIGNPERERVSDYMLLEWDEESEKKASICIKAEDFVNDPQSVSEPSYTFFVFHVGDGIPELEARYSTESPIRYQIFEGEMGPVPTADFERQSLTRDVLDSAFKASVSEEIGS